MSPTKVAPIRSRAEARSTAARRAQRRRQLALAALPLLLGGCAAALSLAEPELCRQAHKSCNPTEAGYAECIKYPECGIE